LIPFKDLGLSAEILRVLNELGFEKPSEIQERSIPRLLQGDCDFIGLAQTGTGKTAAFGLPLLDLIDTQNNSTQALVLAPTRELGQQIAGQLESFSKFQKKINVLAVYGGAAITNQIRALRKPQHIIIATPGRLIDLIKRKAVKLENIRYVVLDEADEMLNMGFKEDIDIILSHTPSEKHTWLFSATMPQTMRKIIKKYMVDPFEVRIDEGTKVNSDIEHQYVMVRHSDKMEALMRFMDINPGMRGVVFCRTKRDTQDLAERLLQKDYKTDALHGDLSQQQRDRVMKRFKSNDLQMLIATDVAARGIDVNDLTHVFHFNLPDDKEYYTHRSGRTARAGKKGISLAFINGREKHRIHRIEKELGISFQKINIPNSEDIMEARIETWCLGILEKRTKGKIDQELLEKVHILFGALSKEELAAKMLMTELEKLNLTSSKDLNEKPSQNRRPDSDFKHHRGKHGFDKRRKSSDRPFRKKSRYRGKSNSRN
jgi:ATP-dependent RNA helicase DeaD